MSNAKNVTLCHDKHIYWRHSEWDFDDFQRVVVDLNIKKSPAALIKIGGRLKCVLDLSVRKSTIFLEATRLKCEST